MLAWAAGIVDGEGCIVLTRNAVRPTCKESWSVRVTISQVDVRMLERLRDAFGGSISWGGQPKKSTWRRQRKWGLTGPKAILFLHDILPYLCIKQEQAELAILSNRYRGIRGIKGSANNEQYRWLAKQLSELKRVPVESIGQNGHLLATNGEHF